MGFYPVVKTLATYKTASPTVPSAAMTESLFSESFPILTTNQFLAQAFWSGSPVGTISIMGSQDNITFNATLYSIETGGVENDLTFDTFGTSVMWVRIDYTFTSGTGALVCSASTKVS